MQQSSAKTPTPNRTPQPQQPIPMQPNYDAFASFNNPRPTSQSTTPAPSFLQQQTAVPPPQSSDPFAALSSSSNVPRQESSFIKRSQKPTPSTSVFNFTSPNSQQGPPAGLSTSASQHTNGASADDDWNFSSALPDDNLPSATSLVVSSKEVEIVFDVSRRKTDDAIIDVVAKFSNKSSNPITEYTFQIAVTKVSC